MAMALRRFTSVALVLLVSAGTGSAWAGRLPAPALTSAPGGPLSPPLVKVQWGGTGWGTQPQQEDPNLRINALEGRVRQLTGQIEQFQFQIRRLEEQLKRFQEDTEYRFQESQNAGGQPPAGGPRKPAPPQRGGTQQRGDATPVEPAAPLALTPQLGGPRPAGVPAYPAQGNPGAAPQLGAPPQVLGQLPADPRTGQPVDLAGAGRNGVATAALGAPAQAAGAQPLPPLAGNPRDAYDQAYGFVLRGEYDRAETAFQAYLTTYPGDRQHGDALYWLGEAQFQRQQWKASAESFLKSYNDYPSGAKAPESLLRLGMSLKQLGQKEPACASFNEVLRKYPRASPAVKQRVQSEQRSAGC